MANKPCRLPLGLTINASTGVISGTVDAGDSMNVPYTVTVSATDSTNATVGASESFDWFVSTTAIDPAPATLQLTLPNAQATVTIDGNPTTSTGTTRTYVSPPLEAATTLTVSVSYQAGVYTIVDQRTVELTPGNTTQVDFTQSSPSSPPEVSARIELYLPTANAAVTFGGRATTSTGTQRIYSVPPISRSVTYQLSVAWTSPDGTSENYSMAVTVTPGTTTIVNLSSLSVLQPVQYPNWQPPVYYQNPPPYVPPYYYQQQPFYQGTFWIPYVPYLNWQATGANYAYMYFNNQWNLMQQGRGVIFLATPSLNLPGRWVRAVLPFSPPPVPPLPTIYAYGGRIYNYFGRGYEGGFGLFWGFSLP